MEESNKEIISNLEKLESYKELEDMENDRIEFKKFNSISELLEDLKD